MSFFIDQKTQITESERTSPTAIELQVLRQKILGINKTIESLLNKKIRIDLEIRKQKNALANLKTQTKNQLKLKVNLEQFQEFPLSQEDYELLKQTTDPEILQNAIALDQELDYADELVQKVQDLDEEGLLTKL